jgi:hypothetical protein
VEQFDLVQVQFRISSVRRPAKSFALFFDSPILKGSGGLMKTKVIGALVVLVLSVIIFQNCGKAFNSKSPGYREVANLATAINCDQYPKNISEDLAYQEACKNISHAACEVPNGVGKLLTCAETGGFCDASNKSLMCIPFQCNEGYALYDNPAVADAWASCQRVASACTIPHGEGQLKTCAESGGFCDVGSDTLYCVAKSCDAGYEVKNNPNVSDSMLGC